MDTALLESDMDPEELSSSLTELKRPIPSISSSITTADVAPSARDDHIFTTKGAVDSSLGRSRKRAAPTPSTSSLSSPPDVLPTPAKRQRVDIATPPPAHAASIGDQQERKTTPASSKKQTAAAAASASPSRPAMQPLPMRTSTAAKTADPRGRTKSEDTKASADRPELASKVATVVKQTATRYAQLAAFIEKCRKETPAELEQAYKKARHFDWGSDAHLKGVAGVPALSIILATMNLISEGLFAEACESITPDDQLRIMTST
jgi:hypothetical protein